MSEIVYREGDRVRVKQNAGDLGRINDDVRPGQTGTIVAVTYGDYRYRVEGDTGMKEDFRARQLELVEPDLHHLQAGDILLDEDGDERKVIDALPNSVLLSVYGDGDDLDTTGSWFTPGELERDGLALKQDTPTEVTELTLEDIAKLKGVDVSQIKIVEK